MWYNDNMWLYPRNGKTRTQLVNYDGMQAGNGILIALCHRWWPWV